MNVGTGRRRRYEQVVDYCSSVVAEGGIMPSYRQIADALNMYDRATVCRYVRQAEQAGLLSRTGIVRGGRDGTTRRIRLGRPEEVPVVLIKLGREL